jgi:hypothetical protein
MSLWLNWRRDCAREESGRGGGIGGKVKSKKLKVEGLGKMKEGKRREMKKIK